MKLEVQKLSSIITTETLTSTLAYVFFCVWHGLLMRVRIDVMHCKV